ncbi:MAG: LamG domain-containing protein, partial [Bacteroidota bacterium]
MNRFYALFLASIFLLLGHRQTLAQSSQLNLAKGLRAYYTFSHQEKTNRVAGSQNIVIKSVDWVDNRFGDPEDAVRFDGNQHQLLIPKSPTVDIDKGDGYSLSLWIRPRDDNPGCLILKDGDYGIKWNGMKKPLTVFDGVENGFPSGQFKRWVSAEWFHIAVVKKGQQLSLYVNGQLDTQFELESKSLPENLDVYIGKHPYFWGAFAGQMDDIALYDRPLNKFEVLALGQIENIPLDGQVEAPKEPLDPKSLLGVWQGVVTQPNNELVPNYSFWIYFSKIENGKLKGFSRIEVPEKKAYG